ncbi:hypothetical protein [Devosia salina]|uniref:Uncharacterized protein n=1 Tax=Devosia salina TaxID=2860336 RepID=A0ABX8WAV0_9HYPH|nr:hypothetical protein [Devosia salina]QYO76094.1 hypothetical protein K1X15_15940 [Devosia salina]
MTLSDMFTLFHLLAFLVIFGPLVPIILLIAKARTMADAPDGEKNPIKSE